VIGENKYRSVWKVRNNKNLVSFYVRRLIHLIHQHCYGGAPPPLQIETTVVDSISIMERKPTTTRAPSKLDSDDDAEDDRSVHSEQKPSRSLSEPMFDVPAEDPPGIQAAAKDPDTFTVLPPQPDTITGKSKVTSAAGTISHRIWWLNTVLWSLERSDFMIAVSVGFSAVLFLLRRTWW